MSGLGGVCGQGDRKSHSLKAMGTGLGEQPPGKPALMGSQQGLAQLEDVCFVLPSSFCIFQGGSASLFSRRVPWHLPHCSHCPSPGPESVNPAPRGWHCDTTACRRSSQPGRRPWYGAAAPFVSSQPQLGSTEVFLLCSVVRVNYLLMNVIRVFPRELLPPTLCSHRVLKACVCDQHGFCFNASQHQCSAHLHGSASAAFLHVLCSPRP